MNTDDDASYGGQSHVEHLEYLNQTLNVMVRKLEADSKNEIALICELTRNILFIEKCIDESFTRNKSWIKKAIRESKSILMEHGYISNEDGGYYIGGGGDDDR